MFLSGPPDLVNASPRFPTSPHGQGLSPATPTLPSLVQYNSMQCNIRHSILPRFFFFLVCFPGALSCRNPFVIQKTSATFEMARLRFSKNADELVHRAWPGTIPGGSPLRRWQFPPSMW